MTVVNWMNAMTNDVKRRGLPQMKPLLQSLTRMSEQLRAADDARADGPCADAIPTGADGEPAAGGQGPRPAGDRERSS